MEFPYKCCQCGFCCLSSTCPIGQSWFNIGKHDPCPALYFDGDYSAVCMLIFEPAIGMDNLGIGQGCCIKARAYAQGVEYDFASLPAEIKKSLAQKRRRK